LVGNGAANPRGTHAEAVIIDILFLYRDIQKALGRLLSQDLLCKKVQLFEGLS